MFVISAGVLQHCFPVINLYWQRGREYTTKKAILVAGEEVEGGKLLVVRDKFKEWLS